MQDTSSISSLFFDTDCKTSWTKANAIFDDAGTRQSSVDPRAPLEDSVSNAWIELSAPVPVLCAASQGDRVTVRIDVGEIR
jgi:hypothetical protein